MSYMRTKYGIALPFYTIVINIPYSCAHGSHGTSIRISGFFLLTLYKLICIHIR